MFSEGIRPYKIYLHGSDISRHQAINYLLMICVHVSRLSLKYGFWYCLWLNFFVPGMRFREKAYLQMLKFLSLLRKIEPLMEKRWSKNYISEEIMAIFIKSLLSAFHLKCLWVGKFLNPVVSTTTSILQNLSYVSFDAIDIDSFTCFFLIETFFGIFAQKDFSNEIHFFEVWCLKNIREW